MLRGTVGITVATQAWLFVASTNPDLLAAIPAAVLVRLRRRIDGSASSRPCAARSSALGYALVLFTPLGGVVLPRLDGAAAVVGLAAAVGLGLLGPGAFSIDARLFGRREIFIPAKDSSDRSRTGETGRSPLG